MSKVTIIDLVTDYEDADMNTCNKSRDIEVVPRKMVEMIIEYCLEDYKCMCESQGIDQYANGICVESKVIKRYAESLLEKFEEDGQI